LHPLYHFPVHRFVAILLLLLVPLRVFGAEAFGVCMLEHQAAQSQAMAGMPDDCPMMSQSHGKADTKQHPAGESGDCSGCQMCMTLAGPDATQPATGGLAPERVVIAPRISFRSAESRRTLRPPIA
jgi:hypothetical protein